MAQFTSARATSAGSDIHMGRMVVEAILAICRTWNAPVEPDAVFVGRVAISKIGVPFLPSFVTEPCDLWFVDFGVVKWGIFILM